MGAPDVDVAEVVRETLSAERQKEIRAVNNRAAFAKLVEFYGSDKEAARAINTFTQGKQHLVKLIDELGATDPDVCVNTITKQIEKKDSSPNHPGVGDMKSGSSVPSNTGLTATKWRDLRKKDPREYERLRPTVMELVAKHGEGWFNT